MQPSSSTRSGQPILRQTTPSSLRPPVWKRLANFLSGPTWFTFPTVEEQLSDAWLGSSVADVMKEQLTFFKEQEQVEDVADDYGQFIDTSFLEAIG